MTRIIRICYRPSYAKHLPAYTFGTIIKTALMHTSINEDVIHSNLPAQDDAHPLEKEEKFFPSGGIAFFIALVILCLIIWFGIYFLMIERA